MKSKSQCCSTLSQWLEPDTFKALSDPSRASLLLQLAGADGPQTVSQLATQLPIDVSVVSRHLKILKEIGVVSAERQGKEILHRLDCGDLIRMLRNLADALETCCPLEACSFDQEEKES